MFIIIIIIIIIIMSMTHNRPNYETRNTAQLCSKTTSWHNFLHFRSVRIKTYHTLGKVLVFNEFYNVNKFYVCGYEFKTLSLLIIVNTLSF